MRIFDVHVHYNGNLDGLDRCVDLWKDGGVEKVALFAYPMEDGTHASVEDVSRAAEKHPDFIVPFVYLTPGRGDCSGELEEGVARGFRGAKFIFPASPYDSDEHFRLYERVAGAGMVSLFHTGVVAQSGSDYQRAWRVSSGHMRPVHLDRIARAFPGMKIIGAHIGAMAWYEEACAVMRWNPNVYFDLSIGQLHYVRKGTPEGEEGRAIKPRMQELYDTGALNLRRILFGSDGVFGSEKANPRWALRTLRFELDAIGATEEEKEAVRWGTAAGLFALD